MQQSHSCSTTAALLWHFVGRIPLLNDGSAFVAFRGTDSTMTGWKEDFNMSFQETVPAQLAAMEYADEFGRHWDCPTRFCGHSKGGNLAVYAASKCAPLLRRRIFGVYNNDGPGFHHSMMEDSNYLTLVPRIHTYVPQSSVVGMLLEHEEPYVVVKSAQLGLLQHDPYSWMVLGGDFVREQEVTAESKFVDQAMKAWLADMTIDQRNAFVDTVFELMQSSGGDFVREQEVTAESKFVDQAMKAWLADMTIDQRNAFVDTVFELMQSSGVERTQDLFRVRNLASLIKSLRADENDMTIDQRNAFVDTVFELMQSSGVERTQDLFRVRNLASLIKSLRADENAKKVICEELGNLVQAAAKSQKQKRESQRQGREELPE